MISNFLKVLPVIGLSLFLLAGTQTGCHHVKNPSIRVDQYKHTIRVACVGDSITWGDKLEDHDYNCYPAVLGRVLGSKFETRNFGVNGATLLKHGDGPYWKTGAFQEAQDYNPDVVIIMLGTNDSKPQNWQYRLEFMSDLKAMINKFKYLPSEPKIWLCTPCPVYGNGQWGITPKVVEDQIIPIIQQTAEDCDVPLIDIFSAMNHHAQWFPDLVHPNAEGAEFMARTIATALTGI